MKVPNNEAFQRHSKLSFVHLKVCFFPISRGLRASETASVFLIQLKGTRRHTLVAGQNVNVDLRTTSEKNDIIFWSEHTFWPGERM